MQETKQPSLQRAEDRPFFWGIVGTGVIARQFASDLSLLGNARVSAVFSRTERAAVAFADATGGGAAFTEMDRLLGDGHIDAVYIATPNSLHAAQAMQSIQAGNPVLVEKPVATSSADARAVFDAAAAHGVLAVEALWSRFLPGAAAARQVIASGALGAIERIDAELAYRRDETAHSRFFDPGLGGGSALDLGVYPLSLAMHLMGTPDRVSGRWRRARSGVDMACEFELGFGAAEARLRCGFDRDGANAMTIRGSAGALRLEPPFLKVQCLTTFSKAAAGLPLLGAGASGLAGRVLRRLPLPGRSVSAHSFAGGGLQFEADSFMKAVRAGQTRSDVVPPEHSIEVLKAIEAVLGQPPES